MKIGFIGLGKMGKNMVFRLLEQGIEVVAWNRSPEPRAEVQQAGAMVVETLAELIAQLPVPRTIWLMLPAGEVTDQILETLQPLLNSGDTVIDGANSFYKDTLQRGERLQTQGIRFIDAPISGGPAGARTGGCMLVGGTAESLADLQPLFAALTAPGALGFFGTLGSGHYAKMIHNGIEYGMMEAIAEGAAVLKHGPFSYDMAEVFRVYNIKTVIESRLVGWTQEALVEDGNLSTVQTTIGALGEGAWTVKTAQELNIAVPAIAAAVQVRNESATVQENSPEGYRNRVVSAQRGKFGGHPVKKS